MPGRCAIVGLALAGAGCGRIHFGAPATARADAATDLASDAGGDAALPNGLLVWLQMETDPTTGIVDSAGGHAVTCGTPGCPTLVPGRPGAGQAYAFSGQELQVAYVPDLDPRGGYTAAAWVRLDRYPTTAEHYACAVAKSIGATTYDSYSLCIDATHADDALYYAYSSATGQSYNYGPLYPAPDGSWHHVAITWDGTELVGYLDGTPVAGPTALAIAADTSDILVGADVNNGGGAPFFLYGALDDVMVFDRALPPEEIAQLAAK